MISLRIFTVVVFYILGAQGGAPKFLMEPFDPLKFNTGHVWWVDSFTASIYGDADRCAHFVIKKSGSDYVIATQFISSDGEMTELDLNVKEDSSHPARFFLEAGGSNLMDVGVVASDYDNWAVVWAHSNGNAAYHVVTTKPQNQEPFQEKLNEVFEKLGLSAGDFKKIKNEDCKNTLKAD